jgi:hypothetical protein
MSMIWFSVSHAKANDSFGTFFNGCGFALRARQSKDFGSPMTIPVRSLNSRGDSTISG